MLYVWVGLGSALGGAARLWCSLLMLRLAGAAFPWGTLVVNVGGSAFIGLFAALTGPEGRTPAPATARIFVMTGICGGFTTFSSFSLETLNLARDGQWARAAANVAASVGLCLAGVWLGHAAAAAWNAR